MKLLRKRAQRFGKEPDFLAVDRYFAHAGAEDKALCANDISDIELLYIVKGDVVDVPFADIQLYSAFIVLQVEKYGFAHAALGHDAPRHRHVGVFHRLKIPNDIRRVGGPLEFRFGEGVAPFVLQLLQFFKAYGQQFWQLSLFEDFILFRQYKRLLGLYIDFQNLESKAASRRFDFNNIAETAAHEALPQR